MNSLVCSAFSGPIDGLLGMDFLRKVKARIDLENGLVEIP